MGVKQRKIIVRGELGYLNPNTVGKKIVDCLNNLKEKPSILKSTLIATLGDIGSNNDGLQFILPSLYSGFTSNNPSERASSVRSFGKLLKIHSGTLPTTLYELFCATFSDPYVIVHQAAVYGLNKVKPRQEDVAIIAAFMDYTTKREQLEAKVFSENGKSNWKNCGRKMSFQRL